MESTAPCPAVVSTVQLTRQPPVRRAPSMLIPWGASRVEMWRGGRRFAATVAAPFVWRCLNWRTMTPFPHPAHRTVQALLRHTALGQEAHAFAHGRLCVN